VDVRRTGRIFGWFFIGTFVRSIPARLLFVDGLGAKWTNVRFVPGATDTTSLKVGAILEFAARGTGRGHSAASEERGATSKLNIIPL
jgi:hypothetical protein